jgi:hypothetical protein
MGEEEKKEGGGKKVSDIVANGKWKRKEGRNMRIVMLVICKM